MASFKELGIEPPAVDVYIGDKVKISKVLNCEIKILKFKIEKSKYEGDYLSMQIEFKSEMRLLGTGSKSLIHMIKQAPESAFPLDATIIDNNGRYEFT